ncbi:NitT/TauT family transport system substrate-binding protein [Caldalkalibacillus uzonensis]|uniref:NitT/TauT family transport system substrate-binding protein n=1 Tax=Caldalkalibacillus uzonensis TaxID=353224 RepID=A0ABU0CUJ9_9BACI|nr:aliphatic sulfonate ABC transporter substrate-binding protein [Caldalkalibacillus uzonensis]MDQ0340105.1 NitT/TauT family transport system substrate-binding protein [Caldalkalibacillus uzonensis]
MRQWSFSILLILLVSVGLVGCGSSETGGDELDQVRIGYFPNLDHAAAIVGIEKGFFEAALGDVEPEFIHFPNGNDFINALDAGELDIGYVGPGPVINYFLGGGDVVILSSAANGATLIVAHKDSGIQSLEDFADKSFGTPGNGCTHNVQLEEMLLELGLKSNRVGGNVEHQPRIPPASVASLFESGQVDAYAAPEPWGTYLVEEGLANVVVEWDEVEWGTTLSSVVLVSTKDFVEKHPETVEKVLKAHIQSVQFAQDNQEETLEMVNDRIYALTQERLPEQVLDKAWERMAVTYETHADALQEWADSSHRLGFIDVEPNLDGLVDTSLLEKVLSSEVASK